MNILLFLIFTIFQTYAIHINVICLQTAHLFEVSKKTFLVFSIVLETPKLVLCNFFKLCKKFKSYHNRYNYFNY